MRRINNLVLIISVIFPIASSGQNYISNPYTRYALGDLLNSGFSYNRSLGGSSVALRPKNQVNFLNPASYTSQDTLSFLFQTGISGERLFVKTDVDNEHSNNMNVDYFVMGFPVTSWCKVSLGLTPFSRTSYLYREYDPDAPDVAIEYRGNGGFNDFYIGGSFQPVKYLSLGMNVSYLFGNITKIRMVDVPYATVAGTKITQNFNPSDLHYRLGFQFYPILTDKKGRNHQFIFGAIYDIPVNVKINYSTSTFRNYPSHVERPLLDTFHIVSDSAIILALPAKFGIGLTYNFNDQFMLTAEYTNQQFSKGIEMLNTMDLRDYSSYRFGAEYVPVPMTSRERARYFERMHYRIGGHYTNSYLSINNTPITDYGVSIGLSFPWRNQQKLYTYTNFNISYEYGVRGTNNNGLIKENYHMFTLGITLFDFWFLQPKYD
jgi:hypothetical protein